MTRQRTTQWWQLLNNPCLEFVYNKILKEYENRINGK
jgi:hypothetical protein